MSSPTRVRGTDAFLQRVEELGDLLESTLTSPAEALDVLVTAVAKGHQPNEVWERLHQATLREDKAADLALAYERLASDRRIKILAAEQRAYLFLRAAAFVGDMFGDLPGATRYAELALAAIPGHPEAFQLLERLLGEAEKTEELALLYFEASRAEKDDANKIPLLKRAASLVVDRPLAHDLALKILHAWVQVEPDSDRAKEELIERLIVAARFRDAAKLLEEKLLSQPPPSDADIRSIHERLVDLYIHQVKEPKEAIAHLEALLRSDPTHHAAITVTEALLENRSVAQRAAAALSDAYESAGDTTSAIAMLTMELKLVKGSRRLDVQRRLAILRQDTLGDKGGALELLAPVVSAGPGDDELRQRYVALSLELDQPKEAALLLARALQTTREPGVRARIGVDVGKLYLKTGDSRRAQGTFQQVIEGGQGEEAILAASRHLVELCGEAGDTKGLGAALELVVKLEPDQTVRQTAARRLTRLYDGENVAAERSLGAWRALLGSEWTDEALGRLEEIYARIDSKEGQADVLAFRAERSLDPEKARDLAFAAAELRTQHQHDQSVALEVWSQVLSKYGPRQPVLERMVPLLEQLQEWPRLAQTLEQLISCVDDEQKPDYLSRLAQVKHARLEDVRGALAALGAALSIDSAHRASRVLLERLLFTEGAELAAADILEPIYRSEAAAAGLVKVLSVRGKLEADLHARFEALYEAMTLAQRDLGDPDRALDLAGQGLNLAVEMGQGIPSWLERVTRLADVVGSAAAKAQVLSHALGKHAVQSDDMLELCRLTGEALANASELDAAVEVYRRALEFAPASRDLLERIDRLLVSQGNPSDRMALYSTALEQEQEPGRRKELLHSIATLEHRELGNQAAAILTWQRALAEDDADIAAHQALIELYSEADELELVYDQLEALLPHVTAERKHKTLLRLARVAELQKFPGKALEHYQRLMETSDVGDEVLERIEELAREYGRPDLVRGALEQRLHGTADASTQADILERLGQVLAEKLLDVRAAVEAWMRGAELCEGLAADTGRARRMYEHVLNIAPKQRSAAERLIDLYAKSGSHEKLPAALTALLAACTVRDWLPILLGLEARLVQAGALTTFVQLVDSALKGDLEPGQHHQLLSAKARALASDPERAEEAAALYRELLETDGTPADVEAFQQFLEQSGTPHAAEDQRWLYEWRAERASEPVGILLDWADTEQERFGEPNRAMELYQRVLGIDPERVDALQHLAALKVEQGDFKGALSSLEKLRLRTDGEQRVTLELEMAAILMDQLRKPESALELVGPILQAQPKHPEALRIVHKALTFRDSQVAAAELLEHVAESSEDDATHCEVLGVLLSMSEGMGELRDARKRWIKKIIELRPDDDPKLYELSLAAAKDAKVDTELWEAAEHCAQKLHDPGPLAEAYAATIAGDLLPEVAESLGERIVNFYEEWFDDAERVIALLRRVLELCPSAVWASDRLKLVFNSSGRWEDLFQLYDWALNAAKSTEESAEVLREAAMAAKDFAGNAERAIYYFELLNELIPRDARVELALERLYERNNQQRPLIALCEHRLEVADPALAQILRARIASLFMDLGEPLPAFAYIRKIIEADANEPEAYALLERLVGLSPAAPGGTGAATGVSSGTDKDAPADPRAVKERCAELLSTHYDAQKQDQRVVEMLEVLVDTAESIPLRVQRLRRLVEVRLERLDDAQGAFENVAELVRKCPEDAELRALFAKLAERLGSFEAQVSVHVEVGRRETDHALAVVHLSMAARCAYEKLGQRPLAIELYFEVLAQAEAEPKAALLAARELDAMLEAEGRFEERCMVLEKLAALEVEADRKVAALGVAARLAMDVLSDPDRAVDNWRRRLALGPKDRVAQDGLVEALAATPRHRELIEALGARILAPESAAAAKRDAIWVARIYAEKCDDAASAIATWRRVRADHGRDAENYRALHALLSAQGQYRDLAELVRSEAEGEAEASRKAELYRHLGAIHNERTLEPERAIEAFVQGHDWQTAREVAGASRADRELTRTLLEKLMQLAMSAWTLEEGDAQSAPARTVDRAIEELRERGLEEGNHTYVVDLLLRGSKLPFLASRKRQLKQEAACLYSDRLSDPKAATQLLRELFAEDPADEVAAASVSRLAALLAAQGLDTEVTSLWEQQAECKERVLDRAGAALLWARAGELAEHKLTDVDRAIANYRRGAALGGESSLVALSRIYTQQGEHAQAAQVLEWLCAQSPRETLAGRALALANAYVSCNRRRDARARLEQAGSRAIDAGEVRTRLAELYREDKDWDRLAVLLSEEAERAEKPAVRLQCLTEAARLHVEERQRPGEAVPLLEQALALEPDDYRLRLSLSDALLRAERFDAAMEVLREQIERYGARRPKERALVHYQLAKVSLARGQRAEALGELDKASKIDPAHPEVLYALARLAFEEGQLERAERQYRGLLLIIGRETGPNSPTRVESLLDLAAIAEQREDATRAQEFVESAFEAAAEDPREAKALERALQQRGQRQLLVRALRSTLERSNSPLDAITALAQLAELLRETPGQLEAALPELTRRALTLQEQLERNTPNDFGAWSALGRAFEAFGDSDAESRILERRVRAALASGEVALDAEPFYRLAELKLSEKGSVPSGLELLEKALSLTFDPVRAIEILKRTHNLGATDLGSARIIERLTKTLNDPPTRLAALHTIVRFEPENEEAAREAYKLAIQCNDAAQAEAILRTALSVDTRVLKPEFVGFAMLRLAKICEASGRTHEALVLREKAIPFQDAERAPKLRRAVAEAAVAANDLERAVRNYEILRQANPQDREVWEPLLSAYRTLGNTEKLVTLLSATIPLATTQEDRARLRLEEANVLLSEPGREEEAIAGLKQVLSEDSRQVDAALLLSKVLEKLGRLDELTELLNLQLEGAKRRAHLTSILSLSMRLGDLLERQARPTDALLAYQTVLDFDKSSAPALGAVLRLSTTHGNTGLMAEALEGLLKSERGPRAEALCEQLHTLRIERGEDELALEALELGFEACPMSSRILADLVESHRRRGNASAMVRVLGRAFQERPDDEALLHQLVDAYQAAGQPEAALNLLEPLISASPQRSEWLVLRANILRSMSRDLDALDDLDRANALTGTYGDELASTLELAVGRATAETRPALLLRWIDLLLARGERETAGLWLAELVKESPKDKGALRKLAELEEEAGNFVQAGAAYRKLVTLEEGEALTQTALRLAQVCKKAGRIEDARGALERACAAAPNNELLRENLYRVYAETHAHAELGELLLRDAASAADVSTRLNLMYRAVEHLLEPEGDLGRALSVLKEAQELSPESVPGLVLLARAHAVGGDLVAADNVLTTLIESYRGRRAKVLANVHRERARILLLQEEPREALSAMTQAFEMDLKNYEIAMELGLLALDHHDDELATRAFRTVAMMRTGTEEEEGVSQVVKGEAHFHLAVLAQRQGDPRRAKVLVAKALTENPDLAGAQEFLAQLETV
ncbi:MAG: tetratricopeptide repeat protein [Polyangiaceae bacterium]|nr:tetratricopeptide repeat protein [Polyangiaceae bacterium]